MEILILTNSIGGLYSFRKELVQKLLDQNHTVHIASPKDERVNYFREIGCQWHETNFERRSKNPFKDIKLLMKYLKLMNKLKPDVVMTYTIKPNIYGGLASKILKTPYIVNITGLGTAVENASILQKVTLLLYKVALRKARCVFFQNESNMNFFIKKKIVKANCRLIPGSGVNLTHYSLLDYQRSKKVNFLFIARIIKEKGIDHYLEMAEFIRTEYPNVHFHILGPCNDEYYNKIKSKEREGIVKYHGKQKDMKKYYSFSHCTIHPTYYPEGMSNVLLESAACGRPVITTNRSGCREIVDDGLNGYLIEEKSTEDLISKVRMFLKLSYEEKRDMGLYGRKKVENEFDRNTVINAYLEEIYRR